MKLQKIIRIAEKLEAWADQKIPEFVSGPKRAVTVSLDGLLSGEVDALIKVLRISGRTEWAKVINEDHEKLQYAAKRSTLDLVKRIVESKMDKRDKQYNKISALDILDPNFKALTDEQLNDNDILTTVYFDECAQRARNLAQTLRQITAKAETEGGLSTRDQVSSKYLRTCDWLWKLYEKTLKVIMDAVLEKLWPK